MLKISSILPNTARVASADMSEAHPVRPGVPTFGRPVGRSHDADSRSRMELPMHDMRTAREYEHAKIINDISNSFFMNNKRDVGELVNVANTDPIIESQYENDVYDSYETEEPEYIRHGQYLDVEV